MLIWAFYAVFCSCALLLFYVWAGYPALLKLLPRRGSRAPSMEEWPELTVLLTVWNGEASIAARLQNILAQDYPPDRIHVFVASDGSTDSTTAVARAIGDARVVVGQFPRGGKSRAQNAAVAEIRDPIVVFTDADTRFAPDFLREVARPFADPAVGCVSGRLVLAEAGHAISVGQSLYWRLETWLRREESVLGLLATASGACMACRRTLLRPLLPSCGEDCTVPLDVAKQGYKVVHCDTAIAYDDMPASVKGELRARARMTSRNLRGTVAYTELLNPLRHLGYAFSLWSHKLLRWMTPLFLLGILVSSAVLYPASAPIVLLEVFFLVSAGLGAALHAAGLRQPRIFSAPFSFLLANTGFLLGIIQFVRGEEPVSYANVPAAATK